MHISRLDVVTEQNVPNDAWQQKCCNPDTHCPPFGLNIISRCCRRSTSPVGCQPESILRTPSYRDVMAIPIRSKRAPHLRSEHMLPINHPSSITLSCNGAQAEKLPGLSQTGVPGERQLGDGELRSAKHLNARTAHL